MNTKESDRLSKETNWHIFLFTDSEFLKVFIVLLISFQKFSWLIFDKHGITVVTS